MIADIQNVIYKGDNLTPKVKKPMSEWLPWAYWGTVSDDTILYLQSRGVQFAEVYAPYYLASLGSHIANLGSNITNEDKTHFGGREGSLFYTNSGKPLDCRLHIFFISSPGMGKSFFLSQFLDNTIGFLHNTHIPTRRYTQISTAGMIGSAVQARGKASGVGQNIPGDAEIYKNGIFGFDEMSSVLMPRDDYNIDMTNTILQMLDEGNIVKRTVYGNFDFKTYVTLWGGSQPMRINLSYGLARRFLILRFSPTIFDRKKLFDAHSSGLGVKPNMSEIMNIRQQINEIWEGFAVKEIVWEESFAKFKEKYDISHIDSEWISRLAIGWNVVTNYEPGEETMYVGLHHHLDEMILNALKWRYSAVVDGVRVDVVKMIEPDKEYTTTELKRLGCKNLGISYKDMTQIIEEMKMDGLFEMQKKPKSRFTQYKLAIPEVLHKIVDEEVVEKSIGDDLF